METFWFNIFSSKQVLGELSLLKRYYMSQIIISYNRNSFIDGQVISCDNKYFPIKNIYKQQCNYAYAWILKNKLYESNNFCSKPCNLQKLYDSSVSLVGSVLLISNLVCDEISIIGLVHLSPLIWYCPSLHTTNHGIQILTD